MGAVGALYRWREARLRGAHAREREQAERRLEARLEAGERAEEELLDAEAAWYAVRSWIWENADLEMRMDVLHAPAAIEACW